MKPSLLCCALFPLSLLLFSPPVLARTIAFETLPALTRQSGDPNCPPTVIAYETNLPYQEGGYALNGTANLTAIATNIRFAESRPFSVTWTGTLKPAYRNCLGTARMTTVDGEAYQDHSYMRVWYEGGQVYFTLDMTGNRDPNNYTTSILFQTILNGNPRWRWGGSD
ncbi:hypothetical protein [Lyngbya confervoides]|uniref:Uncharacterized protein n=1 Tax=Lyngbya confervoides BDU141951 TaxID=1574623 RepID=A0ABD4T6V6_9CYAN|nr:hypothetical protein [Lyngbya confervoides]MCM1984210.1 hypothetical protein [Lyngbya confervoides BDU141951]